MYVYIHRALFQPHFRFYESESYKSTCGTEKYVFLFCATSESESKSGLGSSALRKVDRHFRPREQFSMAGRTDKNEIMVKTNVVFQIRAA